MISVIVILIFIFVKGAKLLIDSISKIILYVLNIVILLN